MTTHQEADRLAEQVKDIISEHLTAIYACTRVWEAWSVGTMSEDDFVPAGETEFSDELTAALLAALAKEPAQAQTGGEVLWQSRMRPEWSKTWDAWKECSAGHAADCLKTPSNGGWLYEVRQFRLVDAHTTAAGQQEGDKVDAALVERIAAQWDGCIYEAPGESIDIGASIRAAIASPKGIAP